MKICGRTQMLSHYSLNKSLELIKTLGFNGVEISVLNNKFQFRPDLLEDYVADFNRDLSERIELEITSLSCHGNYIYNDEFFEIVKKTISKTKNYGTNKLIISGCQKRTRDEDEWSFMLNKTKELVLIAEANDIILAVEFEPDFVVGNTNELIRLFKDIPTKNLAANLDLGHVFLCDEFPLASISKLNEKIVHVHIENMGRGVHNHLLPHLGDMNLQEYIHALQSIGFDGGMALDIYSYDYENVAPNAVKFIKGLLK